MTRRSLRLLLEIWLPVVGIAAWWHFSAGSKSFYFPPLSKIVDAFRDQWLFAHFHSDLLPSLARFTAGLGIATVIGVALGLALGLYPPARRAVS